jgi:hypothetical protein
VKFNVSERHKAELVKAGKPEPEVTEMQDFVDRIAKSPELV